MCTLLCMTHNVCILRIVFYGFRYLVLPDFQEIFVNTYTHVKYSFLENEGNFRALISYLGFHLS